MTLDYSALHAACVEFDVDTISTVLPLADALDAHSKTLAVDITHRFALASSLPSTRV